MFCKDSNLSQNLRIVDNFIINFFFFFNSEEKQSNIVYKFKKISFSW